MSFAPNLSINASLFTFGFKPITPTTAYITILEQDGYGISVKKEGQPQTRCFFIRQDNQNWEMEYQDGSPEKFTLQNAIIPWSCMTEQKRVSRYSNRLILAELSLLVSAIFTGVKHLNKLPGKLTYYAAASAVSLLACIYLYRKCKEANFDLANVLITVQDYVEKNASVGEETPKPQEGLHLLLERSDYNF